MKKNKLTLTALAASLSVFITLPALAEEHVVRLLNLGQRDAPMVFEPAFVRAQRGDTIRFEPASSGHYVRSIITPPGVDAWHSTEDQPYILTLNQPGIHYYMCPPHLMMGMVGMVLVETPVNKDATIQAMQQSKGRMYSNGQRIDELIAQLP